ncbi:UNVERIFIED_CONTAM: hypothetical protein LK11_22810 [Mumia flava]
MRLLRHLLDVATRVRPAMARRTGLSTSELIALEHLYLEPLGPNEIGERLGVSSAATTQIVDRLTGHGHVTRDPHPSDRRRRVVTLTDSGRAEVIAEIAPMIEGLVAADAELDEAEREIVARYLRSAIEAFTRVL